MRPFAGSTSRTIKKTTKLGDGLLMLDKKANLKSQQHNIMQHSQQSSIPETHPVNNPLTTTTTTTTTVASASPPPPPPPNNNDENNNKSKSFCHQYLYESVWPGLGLFGESYLLFSIGTLKPIWEYLYPDCFFNNEGCSTMLLDSLTYSVVLGVMTGMILLGYAANHLGRRKGSIVTATIMSSGAWGLTLVSIFLTTTTNNNNNDNDKDQQEQQQEQQQQQVVWLFRSLSILFFIFGIGVGGEYPLSASSASERAMEDLQQQQQQQQEERRRMNDNKNNNKNNNNNTQQQYENHYKPFNNNDNNEDIINNTTTSDSRQRYRGRHIQLVFSMQGMGILCNSITMTALLLITGQGDDREETQYTNSSLLMIWRITYSLGAVMLTYVLISRIQHLRESQVWEDDKKKRMNVQQSRPALLQAVVASKLNEEKLFMEQCQPEFATTISNVSSLSVPSVTVDYHSQSIHISGMPPSVPPPNPNATLTPMSNNLYNNNTTAMAHHHHHHHYHHHPHHHHHQHHHPQDQHIKNILSSGADLHFDRPPLQRSPSTDPEDDLKASPTWLFLQNYGLRLVGSSLTWLLWDVAFYGNKLFQSTFLLTLTGESTTLVEFSMAATLNAAVALLGYFGAAMLVDKIGRRNLQQYGFLITGTLFVLCGFLYFQLSPSVLVGLYLASSFFGQLGPNATTFLIPAEIFPTEMRSLSHGICAASGKAGALIAAILFNHMDNELDLFLFCGYASFVACLITFCTIPETLGLDLYEIDKRWRMILEGRKGEYNGEANHPRFLSYWERSKLYQTNCSHIEVE